MADIAEIKGRYPQYADMSDEDFADKFHQKFYSDMPRDEFDEKLGVKSNDSVLGAIGQSALNLGSTVVGGLGGGLGYLGGLATGDPEAAKAIQEGIQEKIKYNPTNKYAKKVGELTSNAFETAIDEVGKTLQTAGGIAATDKRDKTLGNLFSASGAPRGQVDPEIPHALAEMAANVMPFPAVKGLTKFKRAENIKIPDELPPPKAPPPVDPNLELYQKHAAELEAQAKAEAAKPIYVDPEGVAARELPPSDVPYLPPIEGAPRLPEAPRFVPEALPQLHDPMPEGLLPEAPRTAPDLALLDKDAPVVPRQGEVPLPKLPEPDRGLLDLQDRVPDTPLNAKPADTPLPEINFPDRSAAFDADPRLLAAQRYVSMESGKVTPEARARVEAKRQEMIALARNEYGIDADTARQKLYETGGETQGVIKKTYDGSKGLGSSRRQGGGIDPNLMTLGVGSLIERFKKKAANAGPVETTPVTKAQTTVVPKPLRDYFRPINKAEDVMTAVIKNGEKDIPAYKKEGLNDLRRSTGSGIRIHAERTGNSTLMYTHTQLFDHGEAPAKAAINKFINAKDGVGPLLKKLDHKEQVAAWKALKMEDKHNTRYSPDQLKELGFSENIHPLLDAIHNMHDNIFSQGGRGDYRAGYTPHSWRGDYTAVVRDKATKKTIEVLNGKNEAEINRAIKNVKERFPNADISDVARKPLKTERSWNRGVLTIQDIMNVLKDDGHLSNEALNNIVNDRDIKSTRNLFGGNNHDLNRATNEIRGWDGDKPWLSDAENASEGWKSLIATAEQQYFHHHLQEPVNNIKNLLSNPDMIERQPNAVKAAEAYVQDKVGSNDIWATGRGINTIIDGTARIFGQGGSAPVHLKDGIRKFTHLWQLGINIKNFAVQLTQPVVSGLPYLKLMQKAEGMGGTEVARGTTLGIARYIRSLTEEKLSHADQFTKDMTQYATDNGMRSFAETENAMDAANSKFQRTVDKFGNALPGFAEKVTRAPMFSVISSMLKESWDRDPTKFVSQEELFQTAKNYTQTIMVDYSQNPSVYRKSLGALGSLAGQFKTYGFATTGALRLLYTHDKVAFATAVGMLTYVTGINGLPFYQDLNNLVKNASGIFGKKLVDIEDLYKNHFPEIAKMTGLSSDTLFHGGLSKQLNTNVEKQFGFSNTIPEVDFNKSDSPTLQILQNLTPSMSGVVTPIAKGIKGAMSTNKMDQLDAVKNILPNQLRGPFENRMLTTPQGNVINPATGQYQAHTRTKSEQMARNFNLTSNEEVRDKETKFKADQQTHFLQEKQRGLIDDMVKRSMSNSINDGDMEKAVKGYIEAGGDPATFVSTYIKKLQDAHTEGIARGAGIPSNSISSINKFLRYHPELVKRE